MSDHTVSFRVTFLPKDSGACPADLVVENAPGYSQEFADQIARHLGIRDYAISLDSHHGWITNRRTRASRHFTYGPTVPGPGSPAPVAGTTPAPSVTTN